MERIDEIVWQALETIRINEAIERVNALETDRDSVVRLVY